MARKALCIGINNYPGTGNDLSGCINDANDWRAALQRRGFIVQQLLDSQATKDAMYQGMLRLVREARPGDIVVITYSGHGSTIPDINGDEPDGRTEVLCPYDIFQNRPLTDDELADIFAQRRIGVRIALISDSCFGGTLLRRLRALTAGARPGARFLSPESFLPPDVLLEARDRAGRRSVGGGIPRPIGGIHLGACQDNQYCYDTEFNGRPNGAFSYYALQALNALRTGATYEQWYQAIRASLPSSLYPQTPNLEGMREQATWHIFEGAIPMSTPEQEGAIPMSTPEQPIVDGSRMAWGRPSQQLTRSANGTTTASSIPDRSYVATTGNGNALFLIENGRRQRIYPNDVERLQITQNDILQVDPLALSYFPPAGTGQRAIGRNLQFYHPSDLHSGHDMQSWAWLEGTTLTTRTVTRTHTWFGGYTGGVQFVLYDVNGRRIQHNEIRYRYGVDGRAFGSGTQDKPESEQLPQIVADAANTILITHYWDPKVDLVAAAIQTAEFVWEVIQTIWDWYQQGQNVNAGSESFE